MRVPVVGTMYLPICEFRLSSLSIINLRFRQNVLKQSIKTRWIARQTHTHAGGDRPAAQLVWYLDLLRLRSVNLVGISWRMMFEFPCFHLLYSIQIIFNSLASRSRFASHKQSKSKRNWNCLLCECVISVSTTTALRLCFKCICIVFASGTSLAHLAGAGFGKAMAWWLVVCIEDEVYMLLCVCGCCEKASWRRVPIAVLNEM